MKTALIFVAFAIAVIFLLEDIYQSGFIKGYDEGVDDSIQTFQKLVEEEEAKANG